MSPTNQILWAFIGLLLTIIGTFINAYTLNPPWYWAENPITIQSLGISFQIAAVLFIGCVGGKNAAMVSQLAYLILGLFWFPVFSFGGGIGYIFEPTFGYLVGFIPGAWLCGKIAFITRPTLESLALSSFCGLIIIHAVGLVYLVGLLFLTGRIESIIETIQGYSFSPFPGQAAIACLVALLALIVRKILLY